MRTVLAAMAIGIVAANAGFAAGMAGAVLIGPWMGSPYSVVAAGISPGAVAMVSASAVAFCKLHRLRYAILLSH